MTPLIWMHHAFSLSTMIRNLVLPDNNGDEVTTKYTGGRTDRKDNTVGGLPQELNQVLEIEHSILELGLEEFLACSFIRLYHFNTMCDLQLRKISRRRCHHR